MAFDACGMTNEQRYSDADRARIRAGFAWIGEHDPDVKLGRLARLASQELTLWAVLRDSVQRERERMHPHGHRCSVPAFRRPIDRRSPRSRGATLCRAGWSDQKTPVATPPR